MFVVVAAVVVVQLLVHVVVVVDDVVVGKRTIVVDVVVGVVPAGYATRPPLYRLYRILVISESGLYLTVTVGLTVKAQASYLKHPRKQCAFYN